ncbi:MAG: hypothetical protein JWO65_1103 [Sphingomonas bacterium]|nr:hypothetical protein [Sphingomonas bacterium]
MSGRAILRGLLALAYFVAGVLHIRSTAAFLHIVPGWVPYPRETVLVTGACEIAGAIGLLVPRTRRLAGIMLAAYAVCVFPANIKHMIDDLSSGTGLSIWYHGPRMIAQPLIVWWALYVGEVIYWPFRRRVSRA